MLKEDTDAGMRCDRAARSSAGRTR